MQRNQTAAAGMNVGGSWSRFVAFGLAILFAAHTVAQAPAAQGGAAAPPAAEELDALVGRIALYPDDLVSIILPASTSPLQVVQADRYLDKRKADPKLPIDDKWDDAVKSLLNYPDVVKMMSADLDWTSALGEAVVADQGAVLEAIQSFRRRAQAAGNLKSDGKQVVAAEQEVITIVPADPQVIYVPQYNPTTVVTYGVARIYGYYPTAYPSYYYPYAPGAALAAGVIWGAAIGAAWNGGRYATTVRRRMPTSTSTATPTSIPGTSTPATSIAAPARASSGGRQHRLEVEQATGSGQQLGRQDGVVGARRRYARGWCRSCRRLAAARASSSAAGGGGGAASRASRRSRPAVARSGSAVGIVQRFAARQLQQRQSAAAPGGDAFGGYSSGRQTQMDSSRGASSRSSIVQRGSAALAERRRWFTRRWRWWRWSWRWRSAVIAGDAHAPNPFNLNARHPP